MPLATALGAGALALEDKRGAKERLVSAIAKPSEVHGQQTKKPGGFPGSTCGQGVHRIGLVHSMPVHCMAIHCLRSSIPSSNTLSGRFTPLSDTAPFTAETSDWPTLPVYCLP